MFLIADGGSTKTEWAAAEAAPQSEPLSFTTQGINPFVQDEAAIASVIKDELLPHLKGVHIDGIFFYGAGCTPQKSAAVERCLKKFFPHAGRCEVASDLLGAARALLGHGQGIAAILGTGSNSGLYNGKEICAQTPSMGYILGDEGGGAYLGKRLVADVAKGLLSRGVQEAFHAETGLSNADILESVYRSALPNRFLASLVPFLSRHRKEDEINGLITDSLRAFFERNIAPYGRPDLPVCFVGGIAHEFAAELREAAHRAGFSVGTTALRPMAGLIAYHKEAF